MRARLQGWGTSSRKRGRQVAWLAVLGGLAVLFGLFWVLMGLLMAMRIEEQDGAIIGGFCAVTGGVIPCIVGAVLIALAVRRRATLQRLGALVAWAERRGPSFSQAEVAQALEIDAEDAEALVLRAVTEGLLSDDESPVAIATSPGAPRWRADGTLEPGAVLGGTWRVDRLLGAGGMGQVYEATHTRTGRRYALKTLPPSTRLAPTAIERFEREARAASALGHPGICPVHDFDQTDDGLAYLVMELLEGETLEDRLRTRGALEWAEARTIAVQVADALAAAHAAGLLHRDVKPANVFLRRGPEGERAVLLDFGLVKPLDDAATSRITATGEAVGTPLYMSPEQARGEALDVRADIYGLAAVVYEMVTGVPPFLEPTVALAYAKLLDTPCPRVSRVAVQPLPEALDALLEAALAKDPTTRPPDIVAFRDAIGAA
ncbi:MAG: serine/threonine protein kinase [Deltaproteobacteria bacterium]|nr:serine/threonine protein kinase [Deltaproteobacteria bacterium]